jgi:deazaflavin-dependent oxidoreductase (nitroreductase family)
MTGSWLAPFVDVECCDLITTGRRTGRPHEIEIWFGVVDETMYVLSGNGVGADWFRNLQADPVVRVKVDDDVHEGVARVVTDADERERVGDVMGGKYVWSGDSSIGLTYEAWCYEVPAVAVEFRASRPR